MLRNLILLISLCSFTGTSLVAQNIGHTQTGVASYFSDEFDGDRTAFGEIYRKEDLVAAHSLFPHNSRVRVTNLANKQDVIVRVIDEGPFIEGRIIEVSSRAAELLGFGKANTIRVNVELLSTPDQPARNVSTAADANVSTRRRDQAPAPPAPRQNDAPATPRNTRAATEEPAPTQAERQVALPEQRTQPERKTAVVAAEKVQPDNSKSTQTPKYRPAVEENELITTGKFADGVYKIEIREAGEGKFGVQVASLSDLNSAMQEVAKYQSKWFDNILIRKIGETYKVILGPFDDQASASNYVKDLKKRYKVNGFTVELP